MDTMRKLSHIELDMIAGGCVRTCTNSGSLATGGGAMQSFEETSSGGGGSGVDSGQAGLGAGLLGLGLLVASGPVGWIGIAGATALSFGGGFFIGNGLANNGDTGWISEEVTLP